MEEEQNLLELPTGFQCEYLDDTDSVLEVTHPEIDSPVQTVILVSPSFFITHDLLAFYKDMLPYGRVWIANRPEQEFYDTDELADGVIESVIRSGVEDVRLIAASMGTVLADSLLQKYKFTNFTSIGPIRKGEGQYLSGMFERAAKLLAGSKRVIALTRIANLFLKRLTVSRQIPSDIREYYNRAYSTASREGIMNRFQIVFDFLNRSFSSPVFTNVPSTVILAKKELGKSGYNIDNVEDSFPNSQLYEVPGMHGKYIEHPEEYRVAIKRGLVYGLEQKVEP